MLHRRTARCLAVVVLSAVLSPALASEPFPFGTELMLDAAPMRGSKRVPMIEVAENGSASIDLWCASLRGQVTIGGASIAIVPGPIGDAPLPPCQPERQARDADLLAALSAVTGWRRSGELVELSGPTPLRFRVPTN